MYSVGILSALILVFSVILLFAYLKDKQDDANSFYMKYENYNLMKHYLIKFRKDNWNGKIRFFKFNSYLIKVIY